MTSRTSAPTALTPFRFYTSLVLQESTGLRASTLPQLVRTLRQVPESCIYYHTHDFLLSHHYLTPEPSNDFAYWVAEVLREAALGEQLAGIDTMAYTSLEELRGIIADTIEEYLHESPIARLKFVSSGEEFFFLKSVHVVLPTAHAVSTLLQFAQALECVSVNSLYYHLFTARLRFNQPTNDFAFWIGEQLNLRALAEQISRLNLYTQTLDTLRAQLLAMIRQQLGLL